MRVDSMANELVRSVREVIQDERAKRRTSGTNRKSRNGDGLPLFVWLRAARVYANGGSPVMHLLRDYEEEERRQALQLCGSNPNQLKDYEGAKRKIAWLMSRTKAAACVVRRLNRSNPMTATQLQWLHWAITSRYSGSVDGRTSRDWTGESAFRDLYERHSSRRLEVALLEKAKDFHPYSPEAPAVLTSKRLTDSLLMAHLYAAAKPSVVERI